MACSALANVRHYPLDSLQTTVMVGLYRALSPYAQKLAGESA